MIGVEVGKCIDELEICARIWTSIKHRSPKMLSMSQTGYSKYETGENDIPTAVLIKLAEFYNTSVDYLLGLTDEKTRYPARQDK